MPITRIIAIMLGGFAAIVALAVWLRIEQLRTATELAQTHQRRAQAFLVAEAMRQSSRDLTRFVRAYVITGEPRYLEFFQEILAIRDGTRPRPRNYDTSFWDRVILHGRQGIEYGPPRSLEAIMREADFTDEEFEALARAKRYSDELAVIETEVMASFQAKLRAAGGDFRRVDATGERTRLFDRTYNDWVARIMAEIEVYFRLTDQRAVHEIERVTGEIAQRRLWQWGLVAALTLGGLGLFVLGRNLIVAPLRRLVDATLHFAKGDYAQRARAAGVYEIKALGGAFNQMAQAIESDIARRQTLETELAGARDAAQQASRAKGEFLANMSHEIRTPMNAVTGMTHLALQTELSAKQRNYLTKIEGAAQSLLRVINDVLDFSKIEAGKLDIETIPFALDDVMSGLADLAAVRAQDKKIEVRFDLAPDVPRHLRGDPLRLGQVLTNLVGNAIKFTKVGEVIISATRAAQDADGVTLKFTVKDTGIGMSEDQVARLFQSFSQADASTTRRYGGTGLGLAISKRLVEMMSGSIGVDSRLGAGSTFHFTLRFGLAVQDGAVPVDAASVPARLDGARILLAEDNPVNQELACEILREAGAFVRVVNNGREALKAIADERFDLVLMDMQMPEMDGLEATRALRSDRRLAKLPIIAMTASAMATDRELCLAAGMNEHIAKPIHVPSLLATLARWFASRPPQPGPPPKAAPADAELPQLPDVNAKRAVIRNGGNAALYRRMLATFATHHADDIAKLCAALDQADWRLLQRLAHTLKGTAASLGADALARTAATLENLAAQEDVDLARDALGGLSAQLPPLLDAVRRLPPDASSAAAEAVALSPAAVRELLGELRTQLTQGSSQARDTLKTLRIGTARRDLLAPLGRSVEVYDYEAALKLLPAVETELTPGLNREPPAA